MAMVTIFKRRLHYHVATSCVAALVILGAYPLYAHPKSTSSRLLGAPETAPKTISGTVRDGETGTPLPAANIFVEGTRRGTTTNEEGAYELRLRSLPATVVFRYIGYQTRRITVTETSPVEQNVRLQPASTNLEEVVVRSEQESAADVMRKVIAAKKERRRRLTTFKANAYNRFTISNDTGIVSITESLTEYFWDKERGPREVVRSQRQTANLGAIEGALPAGLLVTNLYDDDIEVGGYELIGVTHPEALEHYRFRIDSVRVLDGRAVLDIRVRPRNRLKSAFTGRISILDEVYAMIEAELRPSRSFLFPPPIQKLQITYRQRFSDFGKDFWLPVSFRSNVRLKFKLPVLLSFPAIRVRQVSRLSDYEVNAALPDSLYEDEDRVRTAGLASGEQAPGDSLIRAESAATVPLSSEETRAMTTIDSTQTLEKAFKPSGPMARLLEFSAEVDDEEGADTEEGEVDSTEGGRFSLPASPDLAPRLWYNRVEGGHLGGQISLQPAGADVSLYGLGGYQTARRDWTYGGGLEAGVPGDADLKVGYHYGVLPRYDTHVYDLFGGRGRLINSLQTLRGDEDYFDYYGNERWHFSLARDLPLPVESRLELGVNVERHFSVRQNTGYDLAGRDIEQPPNPPIEGGDLEVAAEENLRSIEARLELGDSDTGAQLGVVGQRRLVLSVEHAEEGVLGNTFDFTRLQAEADYSISTFLRRRLLPMKLDARLVGSVSRGDLPVQRFGAVDAQLGVASFFGALRTLEDRPYEGEQSLGFFWEHNFRTAPFEALGLYSLAERGWSVLLHGGHARTWIGDEHQRQLAAHGIFLNVPDGFHHEVGLSLSGLLGLFRLDLTKRLDAEGVAVGIGLARIF